MLGRDICRPTSDERRELEQRWGVLFQDGALFSSLTVMQNIEVPLREHCPMPRAADGRDRGLQDRAWSACREATADKFPAQLSGGMRKRAGLARALGARPRDPVPRRADRRARSDRRRPISIS